jgi:hypothetical protein
MKLSRSWKTHLLPWLGSSCVLLILIAIAFKSAWLATHDLDWPYDYDLYRDAAIAQTIIDGRFPADTYYAGEQNWYNPLAPAIIGGIARVSGLAPAQVYARQGAVIALAISLAIFALAVALFGRWAGLASLFAFLFLGPIDVPAWAAPSYSPWLFANLVSLVPFALTLIVALRARETARFRTWAISGVLLGMTFLAHTATAILAGCIVLVLGWDRRKPRTVAFRWGLVLLPAFIVSAPLLISILWHYGLQIKNSAPQNFIWSENELHQLPDLLKRALNFRNAIAFAGFFMLWASRRMTAARIVFVPWLAVCVLMLGYGYARQLWPTAQLPGLVPPFHWLFHLRLAGALLLGYGIYRGVVAWTSLVAGVLKVPVPAALVAAFLTLLLAQHWRFAQRHDFRAARQLALENAAKVGFTETSSWLRHESASDAVVLASPLDALTLLGNAARKTVVIDQSFSNPYVLYEPRAAAATDMYKSLADHDRGSFLETAAKYHVSYVLLGPDARAVADRCLTAPFVTKVFSHDSYTVLRVDR